MGETKPLETNPKKIVRRNVAVALGIICIVLIAGLGAIIEYHTMVINDKNNTIARLNESVNLASSTVLADRQTITQTAGNYTSWNFVANVTGYVQIWFPFERSMSNNTYVRVIWSARVPSSAIPYDYDSQVNMEGKNQIIFPVLLSVTPSGPPYNVLLGTPVEVRVGNANTVGNATETVTITYYY